MGGLFMKYNAYVTEGRNGEESVATPTSFSLFDYFGKKSLWFEIGNDIFTH